MARKTSKYPMTAVADAQATILSSLSALPAERVPVAEALGRVLREDVLSPVSVPAFAASVMDGYAVSQLTSTAARAGPLTVRADLASHAAAAAAGSEAPPLRAGEAAYITTGSPLPEGADAVAMVENALLSADGSSATLSAWPAPGTFVRAPGADVAKGETIATAGAALTAGDVGDLAMCGVREVLVTRRVRVGVLSSGDELRDAADIGVGEALPPGAVYDANRPMLLGLVETHLPCAVGIDLGVVRDGRENTEKTIERAMQEVDVLVSSGGVSMGEKDFIKPVLEDMATVKFGRVNMKPGKPLTFAIRGEHWCAVAMPGNPVSAFVCFMVAARLAVWKLAGQEVEGAGRIVEAVLAHDFELDKQRPEFHRVCLKWCSEKHCYLATSTGKQASSRLLSVRLADALLELPAGSEPIAAGTVMRAHLLV